MNIFEAHLKVKNVVGGKVRTREVSHEIAFPSDVSEISFRAWNDYFLIRQNDPKWVKEMAAMTAEQQRDEQGKWNGKRWVEYYSLVLKYISPFVLKGDVSVLADCPLYGDGGNGIMAIYMSLINLVHNYEPKLTGSFQYKGDTYVIDPDRVEDISTPSIGRSLSANQTIDSLQTEFFYSVKNEDGSFYMKDHKYHIDLALLAFIPEKVLPDGSLEKRPLDFKERERWTEKRREHFKDVDMATALDMDFFLRSSKLQSLNTRMRGSLSRAWATK